MNRFWQDELLAVQCFLQWPCYWPHLRALICMHVHVTWNAAVRAGKQGFPKGHGVIPTKSKQEALCPHRSSNILCTVSLLFLRSWNAAEPSAKVSAEKWLIALFSTGQDRGYASREVRHCRALSFRRAPGGAVVWTHSKTTAELR